MEFDGMQWERLYWGDELTARDHEESLMFQQMFEHFKPKTNNMADAKQYKTKVVKMYRNNKATKDNKQPVFNAYVTLEQPLPAGTYKFGLWEREYNGEITWDTTKIEPHEKKAAEGGYNSNQRQSNQQFKQQDSAPDLPF